MTTTTDDQLRNPTTAASQRRPRHAGRRRAGALAGALVAAALALLPARADAVQLDYTCRDAADVLTIGDERLQFSLVGETVGAAATLGNLLCFVGDRRCSCTRNATDGDRVESDSFSREVGRIIASCFTANPGRRLSGISQEALLNVCR